MKILQELTKYLKEQDLVLVEQIDAWADDVETPLLFDDDINGLECSRVTYNANFYLERFTGDARVLIAHVTCWLFEYDQQRNFNRTNAELAPPTFAIEPCDELFNIFDISIIIPCIENIYLSEDTNGAFIVHGKKYSLKPYDLWVAEQEDVRSFEPNIEATP